MKKFIFALILCMPITAHAATAGKHSFMCATYKDVLKFATYAQEGNDTAAMDMISSPLSYGDAGTCMFMEAGGQVVIKNRDKIMARVEYAGFFGYTPVIYLNWVVK